MKIKMTIDQALEFSDEWVSGMTFHEGSQGWRVVCALLAEEVRRFRRLANGDESIVTDGLCGSYPEIPDN